MPKIETEVDRDVVTIKSGSNKGWVINVRHTATEYLRGTLLRASCADAIALSAAFLKMSETCKDLDNQLQQLNFELTELKESHE
jgi:hypothetical protein